MFQGSVVFLRWTLSATGPAFGEIERLFFLSLDIVKYFSSPERD